MGNSYYPLFTWCFCIQKQIVAPKQTDETIFQIPKAYLLFSAKERTYISQTKLPETTISINHIGNAHFCTAQWIISNTRDKLLSSK